MIYLLAKAPVPLSSDANTQLVLVSAGVVLLSTILASIPIALARRHRNRETVIAILILWALASAGSVSYQVMQQMNWSAEHERQIESGYFNPQDVSDQPRPPILLWSGLAAVYCATFAWALSGSKPHDPPES